MWFRRRGSEKKSDTRHPRVKILLWATIVGAIFGVLGVGEPLEDILRSARNQIRLHPASGDIVVVGIDDKSVAALGRWPWPRATVAKLIDTLKAGGARSVSFDITFEGTSTAADDQALAKAFRNMDPPVTIATRYMVDGLSKRRIDKIISPSVRGNARVAAINWTLNYAGEVWRLPYALTIGGKEYTSLSAALVNFKGPSEIWYPIDYSLDIRSIPHLSAAAVLSGAETRFRNKIVIVGATAPTIGDIYRAPGQGLVAGAFAHVIGAETLRAGVPVELGWSPACVFGLLVAIMLTTRRKSWSRIFVTFIAIAALGIGPCILESFRVTIEVVPSIAMLLVVITANSWAWVRQKGATTNTQSGLRNLVALRASAETQDHQLVLARIQNFAEIASSLPFELQSALVDQIANRFSLGIGGAELFQGDEGVFAWLAPNTSNIALGDQLSGLHALLTTPVIVANRQIDLAVTFGVENANERAMINRIGSAMVAANDAYSIGLKWKSFDVASLDNAEWNLALLGSLDTALDNGDVWVAFQPKLDITRDRISGAEALVRWTHPEKGEISPDQFIPLAEQHGRIERLTMYVLERSVRAAAAVNARGIDFDIAVNLSARLLDNPYLGDLIAEVLLMHKLPPHRLTLEVTESAAIGSDAGSTILLDDVRRLGIGVAIDDYGTGFSTLEYLRKIPATEIKIDKSFVAALESSNADRLMVNSTIQLAHELGRSVVAEGVETAATLRSLAIMGCDNAQGYLIGRPMRFRALARILLIAEDKLAA